MELITSRANPRVKQLRAAFAQQARLSGGLVAIEGDHLIEEALRSGIVLKAIFLSERRPLPTHLPRGIELLRLAQDVFNSAADTPAPQGIAALLVPRARTLADTLSLNTLLLVACNLQDPGNLGTLIRSAEAFGASGLLTTPGTVSPWNGKALRASAGSLFRLPVAPATLDEVAGLRARGIRLLAAVGSPGTGATPAHLAPLATPCALLLGNEGSGLTPEWLALADATLTIRTPGPVESLNAAIAGSLLLYEASRQRTTLKAQRK